MLHLWIKHLNALLEVVLTHLEETHRTASINDRGVGSLLNRRIEVLSDKVFEFSWVGSLKLDFFRLASIFERPCIYVSYIVHTEYLQVVVHPVTHKDAVLAQLLDKGLHLTNSWRFLQPLPPNPMNPSNTAHNITLRVDQCVQDNPPILINNRHFDHCHLLVFHLVHFTVNPYKERLQLPTK